MRLESEFTDGLYPALLELVVETRFGRVVICATNPCVEPLANRLSGLGVSEKSGLGTGLNSGDLDSTQSQAGRGFTQNPTGHFCCLFNCTHDCIILRKSS